MKLGPSLASTFILNRGFTCGTNWLLRWYSKINFLTVLRLPQIIYRLLRKSLDVYILYHTFPLVFKSDIFPALIPIRKFKLIQKMIFVGFSAHHCTTLKAMAIIFLVHQLTFIHSFIHSFLDSFNLMHLNVKSVNFQS